MKYETISDIYAANEQARDRLKATVEGLSTAEAAALPEGEKWSVAMIVEHLSMVEFGTSRICARLIEAAKADGKPGDGHVSLSADFAEKSKAVAGIKVQAPERVHPTGSVTIADSLEKMTANRADLEALRGDLEQFDLSGHRFPHPFFGDITAAEWLIVLGGHEARHTKQIERLLEAIRQ
jgi:hypothetical protein